MSGPHPNVVVFRASVDERYSTWASALEGLPHSTVEEQLHLGRCFEQFKIFFSGTHAWKLFFVKNAAKPEPHRQLSERSVDAMMSAARLYDWASDQVNREELQGMIVEMMGRGQNYGMLGLAAIESLPERYRRKGIAELNAVGKARRTRGDHRWRDRAWRMATLSGDVVRALAELERPSRKIHVMLTNPSGYDRSVADYIQKSNRDTKRIATTTIRRVMEYLAEDVSDAERQASEIQKGRASLENEADTGLAQVRAIMSLPEDQRKATIERIARGIADYYQRKGSA